MDVLHEAVDHLGTEEVTLGDGVGCETRLFFIAVSAKMNRSIETSK